jgi:hypothetical protein
MRSAPANSKPFSSRTFPPPDVWKAVFHMRKASATTIENTVSLKTLALAVNEHCGDFSTVMITH